MAMEFINDFLSQYATPLLYAVLTSIAGFLGTAIKRLYEKYINTKIKKEVVNTCVDAVEQLYKDLHGEDKYNKVIEAASQMLLENNITITELELKMLIESAVLKFKKSLSE